jgi:hypothetical protein
MLVNADSRRKLFAQTLAKPKGLGIGGWSQGFGAGPEVHTFDDNMWWLVPHREVHHEGGPVDLTFVLENSHSRRRLYAQPFKQGERRHKLEKGVGAIMPDQHQDAATSIAREQPVNRWRLVQHSETGTFQLKNRASDRMLFARQPRPGEPWHVGVGAIPNPHVELSQQPPNTFWYVVPQPDLTGPISLPPRGVVLPNGISGSGASTANNANNSSRSPPKRSNTTGHLASPSGSSISSGFNNNNSRSPPKRSNTDSGESAALVADASARAERETKAREHAEKEAEVARGDKLAAEAAVEAMAAEVERLKAEANAQGEARATAELEAAKAVVEAATAAQAKAGADEKAARAAEQAKLAEQEKQAKPETPEQKKAREEAILENRRKKLAERSAAGQGGGGNDEMMARMKAQVANADSGLDAILNDDGGGGGGGGGGDGQGGEGGGSGGGGGGSSGGKPASPAGRRPMPRKPGGVVKPALAGPKSDNPAIVRRKSSVQFADDPTSNAPPSAALSKPPPSRRRPQPPKGKKAGSPSSTV